MQTTRKKNRVDLKTEQKKNKTKPHTWTKESTKTVNAVFKF